MYIFIRSIICLAVIYAFSGLNALSQEKSIMFRDTSYFLPFEDDYNLILSAEKGHLENVKLLIGRGVDVNASTYEGVTALMYASDKGYLEMVKLLIESGADPDVRPWNGISALMSSAKNDHFEVAEILSINTLNINLKDVNGVTAVHFAAAYDNYEIADMLIFYEGDPSIPDNKRNTPLITASFNNSLAAVNILLQNGVNINSADNNGYTALMTAIQQNNTEIINLLIEKGADIHHTNSAGVNALVLAITNEDIELTEKLFSMGAEINKQKGKYVGIIDYAIPAKNKEMTDLLLAYDIKPSRRPNFNKIALGPAINYNITDYMTGFNIGILDAKYNTAGFTGFYFRPAANRVLYSQNADTSYQYWERRYFFHAGIEKRFSILPDKVSAQTGPLLGIREAVTFGSYRGSIRKPDLRFVTIPEIGWYFSNQPFQIKVNYEYINFKTPEINPGRFNLSIFYTIRTNKKKMAPKQITWL